MMWIKILDKLSLYDLFGYLLPGALVIFFLNLTLLNVSSLAPSNDFLKTILFLIFSYYIGVITHEFSEIIQEYFLKLIWGGMHSEILLTDQDKTYSDDFKTKLKEVIQISNLLIHTAQQVYGL